MHTASAADLRFLAAFEECELAATAFGHREHLRIAYTYLTLVPFEAAAMAMETGLHRFLRQLGAPASKYHETLTRAWLLAVGHFMHANRSTASFESFLQADGRLLDQSIMETHYTRERLWSDAARLCFLEPDLQPFPLHGS